MIFPLLPGLRARRNVVRLGSLVLKLAFFLPLPALCQGRTVLFANIPFSFTADGKVLPAGEYSVCRENEHIYFLRTRHGEVAGRMMVYADSAPNIQTKSKLVFRHSATGYFLESAWTAGSRDGIRVVHPQFKEELAAVLTPSGNTMVASVVQVPLGK